MSTDYQHHLRTAGLRVTGGRIALLEVLDSLPHSDADTLFRALHETLPSTSVQAVHNMLGDLTAAGLIRRIEPAGSAYRYERRIDDNHHHLVCESCGAITDIDCVIGEAPCLTPSTTHGYRIQAAEVIFWGTCPACLSSSTTTIEGDSE